MMARYTNILTLALAIGCILQQSKGANPPQYSLPPEELKPQSVVRAMEETKPDWGVVRLKAPDIWAKGNKGKGVKVGVLDTGADLNHPDLKPNIIYSKNHTDSAVGAFDRQGHGTHTAGSIGACGPLPGMAPECSLMILKVLGDNGSGGVDWIAAGIRDGTDNGADVLSGSLGGSGIDTYIPPALAYAESKGVILVFAAGNSGPGEGTVGYPGRYKQSICVGAVDISLRIAGFSSRGPAVFVSGPGVNVTSTYPGGQYAKMSGTSMATPNIAGLAVLWVAANPQIPKVDRPKKFREAIIRACLDLGPPGRDTDYGYGFPDGVKVCYDPSAPNPDPGPIPQPMPIVFTEVDLTPEALERLRRAGVTRFRIEVTPK